MKQERVTGLKNRLGQLRISKLFEVFTPPRIRPFKPSRFSLIAVALISGAFGTYVIFFSKAAPPPAEAPFDNVLSNPIDPLQQLAVPFGTYSHWLQPWRAYMDTQPATKITNIAGLNFNVNPNSADATARLIAENGFKRVRVELGWGNLDYHTGQLPDFAKNNMKTTMASFKRYGIRPLVLLNSNETNPTPLLRFDGSIVATPGRPYGPRKGDRTIKLDNATRQQVVKKYTGIQPAKKLRTGECVKPAGQRPPECEKIKREDCLSKPPDQRPPQCEKLWIGDCEKEPADKPRECAALPPECFPNYATAECNNPNSTRSADPFIMDIAADGTATLSKPLPYNLPSGAWRFKTHKYQPFHPTHLANGTSNPVPNPVFEETMNGWLDYAGYITREVKKELGTDDFDVEVWNELSFGSAFVFGKGYYAPPYFQGVVPTGGDGKLGTILERTVTYLSNPANGVPNVKVGNGFSNQAPWANGENSPLGLAAIDKHTYNGGYIFNNESRIATEGTSIDATGHDNGSSEGPGEPFIETWAPEYKAQLPEFWMSSLLTEHIIRDLSPLPTRTGNAERFHGRFTHPPGGQPPTMWITETNTFLNTGTGSNSGFTETEEHVFHFRAKNTLRHITSHANKGVSALHFYAVTSDGELGHRHVTQNWNEFFAWCNKDRDRSKPLRCVDDPAPYPCDDKWKDNDGVTWRSKIPECDANKSSVMSSVKRLMAAFNGAQNITSPRQLSLKEIRDNHNNRQWEGDGTSARPPLYNRELVAVLPFQVTEKKFIIPAYVMTRDTTRIYQPNKSDVSRQDLPPESYRLKLGNLVPAGATVTAYDPLHNQSVPVSVVSREGDEMVIQIDLTDSPRLITIQETGNYVAPAPNKPPIVDLTKPNERATRLKAFESTQLEAVASDPDGTIAKVEFYDGLIKIGEDTTAPYQIQWEGHPDGKYPIFVRAIDNRGASTTTLESKKLNVGNIFHEPSPPGTDITPPVVSVTSPTTDAVISGRDVEITAHASDDVEVESVQFKANGNNIGAPVTSPPYIVILDTLALNLGNRKHKITAVAKDTAGNITTSVHVVVRVDNAETPPPPPPPPTDPPPSAPTSLAATVRDSNAIKLDWSASSDTIPNPTGIAKYNIFRKGVVVAQLTPAQAGCAGTDTNCTYVDTGLVANTAYTYVIQAVDGAGNISLNSNTASATTPQVNDRVAPSTPANFTGTPSGPAQVNLSWSASSDTGGSGLAGYNIYRNGVLLNKTGLIAPTATSYGDATADPNTTYSYQMEAVDGAGNKSPKTNALSLKTPAQKIGDITGGPGSRPDGKINFQDLLFVLLRYQRGENDPKADVTNGTNNSSKNKVDFQDLVYLLVRFER